MDTLKSLLLVMCLLTPTLHASDKPDPAYQAFLQARGEAPWINAAAEHPLATSAFRPIPSLENFPADSVKRELGFALFHDARLSADGSIGCHTCHMGMLGATDRRPVAVGIRGLLGTRNTPTVFNSAFQFRQFWDGRAFDVDEQALAPITNPVEMGHNLEAVVAMLKADPEYSRLFAEVYPDGVTAANAGNAIAQHTRDMTRTDSPFNEYLAAEAPLDDQALRGWGRFIALGCASCHNGIGVGGNSYQRLASITDFSLPLLLSKDEGLYTRTGREQDRHIFKVPSLHNVALTPPYFHDGSVATLEEAVRQMGVMQAGRQLTAPDVADIVHFLESLSSRFFSSRGMMRMNGDQLQTEMRNQMPDAMHRPGGPMGGGMTMSGRPRNQMPMHDAVSHQHMMNMHAPEANQEEHADHE